VLQLFLQHADLGILFCECLLVLLLLLRRGLLLLELRAGLLLHHCLGLSSLRQCFSTANVRHTQPSRAQLLLQLAPVVLSGT
jgi:hypothetical protein